MNLKEIKELIKIIDASRLSEFQIETDDIKLTLKKEIVVQQVNAMDRNDYVVRDNRELRLDTDDIAVQLTSEKNEKNEEDLHIIKSPIVGVFYAAANPESPNFVKVGDKIKSGQVLCIVEAMKLMNEITSDVEGEVVEILGQNQGPVEYGQPLFKVRKA